MEDGSDGDEFIADNDLDYLSRVLTLRETTSNHEDFIALQQQAAAEGRTLPLRPCVRCCSIARRSLAVRRLIRARRPAARPARPNPTRRRLTSAAVGLKACSGDDAPVETLTRLPDCMLLLILGHLDAAALVRIAVCSRELSVMVAENNEVFWEALVKRRYGPIEWALPNNSLQPMTTGDLIDRGYLTDADMRAGRMGMRRPDMYETWSEVYLRLASPSDPGGWRRLAVSTHTDDTSCWLVIDGHVYDVTTFMHQHPGMADALRLFGGEDATESFYQIPHSSLAFQLMRTLEVPGLRLTKEAFPPTFTSLASSQQPSSTSANSSRPATPGGLSSMSEALADTSSRLKETLSSSLASLSPELPSIRDRIPDLPSLPELPSLRERVPELPSVVRDHLPSAAGLREHLPSAAGLVERLPTTAGLVERLPTTAGLVEHLPDLHPSDVIKRVSYALQDYVSTAVERTSGAASPPPPPTTTATTTPGFATPSESTTLTTGTSTPLSSLLSPDGITTPPATGISTPPQGITSPQHVITDFLESYVGGLGGALPSIPTLHDAYGRASFTSEQLSERIERLRAVPERLRTWVARPRKRSASHE